MPDIQNANNATSRGIVAGSASASNYDGKIVVCVFAGIILPDIGIQR